MTDTTQHLDERLRRPSGIRSLTLGDTKLSYVPDGQATLNARMMLPRSPRSSGRSTPSTSTRAAS